MICSGWPSRHHQLLFLLTPSSKRQAVAGLALIGPAGTRHTDLCHLSHLQPLLLGTTTRGTGVGAATQDQRKHLPNTTSVGTWPTCTRLGQTCRDR